MKHVDFNLSVILNNLGFDEYTEDLYLKTPVGIKAVKGDPKNPTAERVWHTGDLEPHNSDWGITYPSANWIPAPTVFEVIDWFEKYMGFIIQPTYSKENKEWSYVIIPVSTVATQLWEKHVNEGESYLSFNTLENCFSGAIRYICNIADNEKWTDILNNYIKNIG